MLDYNLPRMNSIMSSSILEFLLILLYKPSYIASKSVKTKFRSFETSDLRGD